MYFNDHSPPHFHAVYAGFEAKFLISSGEIAEGRLPNRAVRLVYEWFQLHRGELQQNWERARKGEDLATIQPLP
jgi:hypothetical protein